MPHQKVIATFIVCIALLGSVLIVNYRNYIFGHTSPETSSIVASATTTTPIIRDDWQKTLISITNSTSSRVQIIASQNSGTSPDDNTITSQVSKMFFSYYLADQKNGVPIDQNEAINIANKTISQINYSEQAKKYTPADVKISEDSSVASIKAYEAQMIRVVQVNTPNTTLGVLEILTKFSESKNQADLNKLDIYITSYQAILRDSLKVVVPRVALGHHIVYINTISSLLFDIQGMKQIATDPILGYVAFSNYQSDDAKLTLVIEKANATIFKY